MQFELWLDESGSFEEEDNPRRNPSMVGGVLTETGALNEAEAEQLLGKSFVHFTDEAPGENLRVLEELRERGAEFIVFENMERLTVIDGDTTYLNVLAEGMTRLLLHLSAAWTDFELRVTIAVRKNVRRGYGILQPEEYAERLRERVILALARKALSRQNRWNYSIAFDDARTSRRLMLADAVCNTYLTRTSGKFSPPQKEKIRQLYEHAPVFSFFENTEEREMQHRLAEGNFGEALFHLYTGPEMKERDSFLRTAVRQLASLDAHSRKVQLRRITDNVETMMQIERDFTGVRTMLEDMQDNLFPLLDEAGAAAPEFKLEVMLQLYAVYTHEGNLAAAVQDRLVAEQLPFVEDIMVKLRYFHRHKIRRGMFEKNRMRVHASIGELTGGIRILEDMLEMIDMVEDERDLSGARYEYLGHAYGSRGQGYTMLIRREPERLKQALDDFDRALTHFTGAGDRQRQYLYKSHALSEGGKHRDSLFFLIQACGLDPEESGPAACLTRLKEQEPAKVIFKYYGYFKTMAAAKTGGDEALADTMYRALHEAHITVENLHKHYNFTHPLPFIYWFQARYAAENGRKKTAAAALDEGIAVCRELPLQQMTLKMVELGMRAEKARLQPESGQREAAAALYEQIRSGPDSRSFVEYVSVMEGKTVEELTDEVLKEVAESTLCIN